jgi:hypothetical protein
MYTGDLLERMYPDEDPVQNVQRRDHLVDLYLNMPDKVGKCLLRMYSAHSGSCQTRSIPRRKKFLVVFRYRIVPGTTLSRGHSPF